MGVASCQLAVRVVAVDVASFVTFAPFAYDATAWTSDSQEIVRLADAATPSWSP
jgi:hypothetical protein